MERVSDGIFPYKYGFTSSLTCLCITSFVVSKTAEITGYSREEAFDKPLVSTFIVQKLRSSVQEVLDNALQGMCLHLVHSDSDSTL